MSLNLKEIKEKRRKPYKTRTAGDKKIHNSTFPAATKDRSGLARLVGVWRVQYRSRITASAWGTKQFLVAARMAHVHAFRPPDLMVWAIGVPCTFLFGQCHPTLPRSVCFKTHNPRPWYVFRDALEFLPCFGSNLNPRL